VPGIGLNPTRAGLYTTLKEMGADLTYENIREEGGEPVADLRARFSDNMQGCGVTVEEDEDTFIVHGMGAGGVPGGGTCATHLDHRIAMSFMVLGFAAQQPVHIDDGGPIATSFPIFEGLMRDLGATITRD